jgi:hypothetical protein
VGVCQEGKAGFKKSYSNKKKKKKKKILKSCDHNQHREVPKNSNANHDFKEGEAV